MAAVEANIEYSKRLQSRLERVSELSEFARECGHSINGILSELGWSGESLGLGIPLAGTEPPDPIVTCPFDANHRLLKSSLEKHTASCRLRKLEYCQEEEAEMYDPSFAYENTVVSAFKMDKDLQTQIIQQAKSKAPFGKEDKVFSQVTGVSIFDRNDEHERMFSSYTDLHRILLDVIQFEMVEVCGLMHSTTNAILNVILETIQTLCDYSSVPCEVPENHKRFICDLTPADRLAIYEHVVRETSQQRTKSFENDGDLYVDLAAKLSRDDEQKGPKSHLEILAEMRDYKRRRQSYRAKNVHITKKSYTEVIRDVISVHMEELSRQWKDQNDSGNSEEHDDQSYSLSLKSSSISRRRSGDQRSPSMESKSTRSSKIVEHDSRKKNRSQSPCDRRRSPDWEKERDSRKRREKEHHPRDEDRHRSYKRRK